MNTLKSIISITFLATIPMLYGNHIKLESSILDKVDGKSIGVTGESIALIKQYQFEIAKILLGEKSKSNNTRTGKYTFEGQRYNMQELSQLEIQHPNPSRFKAALRIMRDDFENVSKPFQSILQEPGIKTIMGYLIEESCIKRNRQNSLLYIWSQSTNANEYELFDLHIQSIRDFEIFLIDLNNFLGDLAYSCPRAYVQFKERVEKFNHAQQFITELNLDKGQQDLFAKYINTALSTISKNEITRNKIRELYNHFKSAKAA
jgi:hypothetical protein